MVELIAMFSLGGSNVMGRWGAKQLPSNYGATRRGASRLEIWNGVPLAPTAHSAGRVSFIGIFPFWRLLHIFPSREVNVEMEDFAAADIDAVQLRGNKQSMSPRGGKIQKDGCRAKALHPVATDNLFV